MEHKGHTHVKFHVTSLVDIPYRFRVKAYLTTQEFNDLNDDAKTRCIEIGEHDVAIIDELTAPENQNAYWENYYKTITYP